MSLIINIFGGPSVGKTTLASKLFVGMRGLGMSVEMPQEFPKMLSFEGNTNALSDQLWVLANQHRSIVQMYGQVDYIIMDSPILMSIVYKQLHSFDYPASMYGSKFDDLVYELHSSYLNLNLSLTRNDSWFNNNGRLNTLSESKTIDTELQRLLEYYNIPNHQLNPGAIDVQTLIDEHII